LFDPQTSGGLLAAVKPVHKDAVLSALVEAGYETAAVIGEVLPVDNNNMPMIHLSFQVRRGRD
jgi:selenide,water dikinase